MREGKKRVVYEGRKERREAEVDEGASKVS